MMPRPAQPTPGLRAAGLHAHRLAEARRAHVLQFHVLAFVAQGIEHRLLRQSAEQQARRVRLRIASDHHDPLAQLDERRDGVLGGGGFSDSALSVNCNFSHVLVLCIVQVLRILLPQSRVGFVLRDGPIARGVPSPKIRLLRRQLRFINGFRNRPVTRQLQPGKSCSRQAADYWKIFPWASHGLHPRSSRRDDPTKA